MRKFHLSSSLIFRLYAGLKEKADYAFSFDYKNLALAALDVLKSPSKILSFAGLNFYRGNYKNKKVIIANGGTYSPDTAIGTEILCFLGAKYLVRVGSCAALRREMKIGESVIPDSILDYTGVTRFYPGKLRISSKLNNKIEEILEEFKIYKGCVCSYDALFRETKDATAKMVKRGSIAIDMALASFLKVVSFYKREATGLLVISDNVKTGEIGFRNSLFYKRMNDAAKNIFRILDLI